MNNYEPKLVRVTLDFNYANLEFLTTRELAMIYPNKVERDLLSDLLTDIEQENLMRLYKYFHIILMMFILLIGCALYFTIVVPCMAVLLLLILCIKRRKFQNALFEKIKRAMQDIEDDYNEAFEEIDIQIQMESEYKMDKNVPESRSEDSSDSESEYDEEKGRKLKKKKSKKARKRARNNLNNNVETQNNAILDENGKNSVKQEKGFKLKLIITKETNAFLSAEQQAIELEKEKRRKFKEKKKNSKIKNKIRKEPHDDMPLNTQDSARQPLPLVVEADSKDEISQRVIKKKQNQSKKKSKNIGRTTLDLKNEIKNVPKDKNIPKINILPSSTLKLRESTMNIVKELSKTEIELASRELDSENSKKSSKSSSEIIQKKNEEVKKSKEVKKDSNDNKKVAPSFSVFEAVKNIIVDVEGLNNSPSEVKMPKKEKDSPKKVYSIEEKTEEKVFKAVEPTADTSNMKKVENPSHEKQVDTIPIKHKRSKGKKSTFTFRMPTSKGKILSKKKLQSQKSISNKADLKKSDDKSKKQLEESTPDTIYTFQNSLLPKSREPKPENSGISNSEVKKKISSFQDAKSESSKDAEEGKKMPSIVEDYVPKLPPGRGSLDLEKRNNLTKNNTTNRKIGKVFKDN